MILNYKKIFIVFCIICLFAISNVYAVDLFLSGNTNQSISANSVVQDDEIVLGDNEKSVSISSNELNELNEPIITYGSNSLENDLDEEETYEVTSAATTSSPTLTTTIEPDNSLSVSDVINIILISVCVVLILLAIAILIRCK